MGLAVIKYPRHRPGFGIGILPCRRTAVRTGCGTAAGECLKARIVNQVHYRMDKLWELTTCGKVCAQKVLSSAKSARMRKKFAILRAFIGVYYCYICTCIIVTYARVTGYLWMHVRCVAVYSVTLYLCYGFMLWIYVDRDSLTRAVGSSTIDLKSIFLRLAIVAVCRPIHANVLWEDACSDLSQSTGNIYIYIYIVYVCVRFMTLDLCFLLVLIGGFGWYSLRFRWL